MSDTKELTPKLEQVVNDILLTIEREREREIISRRFGLFDRKETLEQIGEILGITRERVRQLEKAIVTRLKAAANDGKTPHINEMQDLITEHVSKNGGVQRISSLTSDITGVDTKVEQSKIAFLAQLCPKLVFVEDNDNYYSAVGVSDMRSEKDIRNKVIKIIEAIKKIAQPTDIATISKELGEKNQKQVEALASISKQIASLNGRWGLIKWPMVNPKNIRDKIYVVLYENGKYMHFNDIAKAIKKSDFKRKDVTTQAIHNELIKDKRFVLVGRGIYALKEWGYEKGTVADIITQVLNKAGEPLHRDEIVKRVLKSRYVKETTILLNLQGKPQFKRVAKATYTLASE